jgi:hypothetical protein
MITQRWDQMTERKKNMYLVNYRKPFSGLGFNVCKVDTLGEARELAAELMNKGNEVMVSQEIPMKVSVSVDF